MIDYQRLARISAMMQLQHPTYNLTEDDLAWLVSTISVLNATLMEVGHVIRRADDKINEHRMLPWTCMP